MELQREARSSPLREASVQLEDRRRSARVSAGPIGRDILSTAVGWSVILQMHWLHRNGHKCSENCHCDDHF